MTAGIAQITMITTMTASPANGTVAAIPDTQRRIRSPRLRSALEARATRAGPAGSPPARRRTRIMLARDARDRGVDLRQHVGGQRYEVDRAQVVLRGSSGRRDGPFEERADGQGRVRRGDLRRVDDQVLEVDDRVRLRSGLVDERLGERRRHVAGTRGDRGVDGGVARLHETPGGVLQLGLTKAVLQGG